MPKSEKTDSIFSRLREQAEVLIQQRPEGLPVAQQSDIMELIHELHIHQVELEIQNEELKRAQTELSLLHKEYEDLYEFAPCGYISLNSKGIITHCNLASVMILGLDRNKLIGYGFSRFISSESQNDFYLAMKRSEEKSDKVTAEVTVVKPDGDPVWVRMDIQRVIDEPGRLIQWRLVFLDISKKKRIEAQLQKREERLSLAIHAARLGIWDWDIKKKELAWDHGMYDLYGIKRDDFSNVYAAWLDKIHPDDRDRIDRICKAAVLGEREYETEFRIVWPDGTIRHVKALGRVIWDKDGHPERMTGVNYDITARKIAELEVTKSEEKYRVLFDTFPLGITISDASGKIVETNSTAVKLLGIPKKQHENRYVNGEDWRIIRPDGTSMPDDEFASVRALKENRRIENVEMGFVKPDEDIAWISVTAEPMKLENYGVVVTYGDITDKKTSEKALKNSEQKWHNVLVNTPQIGISLDPEANIIFANAHFLKLTGWKEIEVIGQNWFDMFIPEQNREIIRKVFTAVMHQRGIQEFSTHENEILTRNGELRNIAWSNVLTKNIRGDVIDVTCLGIDLTERKRVEKELNFQAMLLNQISDHITATDLEGNILYINEAVIKSLKQRKEDLLGKTVATYGEDTSRGATQKQIINSTLQDGEWTGEVVNYDIDGKEMIMNCRTKLVKDNKGNPVSMIGIATDITEYKKMESQIQQAQKMESIGTLAGGIAHDFNNILFPLIGHAEMVLEDLPEDGPIRDSLKEIYTSSLRARDLVQQILAFARQEKGELKLMKMQPIVKEAMKLIRSTLPATISITQNVQPNCGPVIADPTLIHQIVMNLATNAYHAMEENGGELKVTLREIDLGQDDLISPDMSPGVYACLTVSDTGTGMDKDLIQRIFDPFFTTKERGKGTGMGLSVVHGIVKRLNGNIQVHSEPGKGTEFYISLPVAVVTAENQESQADRQIPGGKEKILLVDDEAAIIAVAKMLLTRIGYHVTACIGSIQALETFRAGPDQFDLVITDMSMPGMSGDKLSIELIKIRPDIPILLCTGFSDSMTDEKVRSLGIRGILMKPILIKDLAQKIREILDKEPAGGH